MAAHGAIPSPWAAIVLTLATFRLLRLIGWDTFPPIASARERLLKGRTLLGELWGCVYCLGFYVSLVVYLFWLWTPKWTIAILAPFALSGAVGLLARNLDP